MHRIYTTMQETKHNARYVRRHLFALALKKFDTVLQGAYGDRKQRLLENLNGRILEIGPGAVANFRHYDPAVHVIGVEPNRFLHPYLKQEADRRGLSLELYGGGAETLNLADQSVDAAVSTLVLCSVTSPAAVLSEIKRVLKPGGRFVFLEHVAAPGASRLRWWQEKLHRLWGAVFDGCHPDRETGVLLERAGFRSLHIDAFYLHIPVVATHIKGVAVK